MIPNLKILYDKIVIDSNSSNTVVIVFNTNKQLTDFISSNDRIFKTNIADGNIGYGPKYRQAIFEVTKITKIKQKQIIAEVKEITLRDRNINILLN